MPEGIMYHTITWVRIPREVLFYARGNYVPYNNLGQISQRSTAFMPEGSMYHTITWVRYPIEVLLYARGNVYIYLYYIYIYLFYLT